MKQSDWLILLLGFKGETLSPALDPVRIQKGMFLLAKEGGLPPSEVYKFEPYNWGPYSRSLRNDLDRLTAEGFVQTRNVSGYSWSRYSLTTDGLAYARRLLKDTPSDICHSVIAIKRRITALSFSRLLQDVYANYPEYATKSLFHT